MLSTVARWFSAKPAGDRFFDLLHGQAALAVATARVLREPVAEAPLDRLHAQHDQGDALQQSLKEALEATIRTPLDREDLYVLSRRLSEVLHEVVRAAEALTAYGLVQHTAELTQLGGAVADATEALAKTLVPLQRHQAGPIQQVCEEIRGFVRRGELSYREAQAALYHSAEVAPKDLLRQEAVLSAFRAALESCQRAAAAVERAAVKHS